MYFILKKVTDMFLYKLCHNLGQVDPTLKLDLNSSSIIVYDSISSWVYYKCILPRDLLTENQPYHIDI